MSNDEAARLAGIERDTYGPMSRYNDRGLAPNPLADERAPQTYDVELATNTRRKGQSFAQEGLGFQQRYHGAFYESVRDVDSGASHADVEVQPAGQQDDRSLLGSGQAIAAWVAVDDAELSAFDQGQRAAVANPAGFPHFPRAGANPNPLGPTWGFSAGAERPGTVVERQVAPPGGGRWRNRNNEAEVR